MGSSGRDVDAWRSVFESYGWAAYPLAFYAHDELVTNDPVTAALDAAVTRSLSVGVPHPQHGIMRATTSVTPHDTLTRLAATVHTVTAYEYNRSGLPHLYVGRTPFVDRVAGRDCVVLGLLVFGTPVGTVDYAPLTLARWRDLWLPYFEDSTGWALTGWDAAGRVALICKPFGYGGRLLLAGRDHDDDTAGSCGSNCGAPRSASSSC